MAARKLESYLQIRGLIYKGGCLNILTELLDRGVR